jgi:hypothetical protein
MRWMLRDRAGLGDGGDAELDARLSQTWEAAAAAVGRVLDVTTGKEALLAGSGLRAERPSELRRRTRLPALRRGRVTAPPRWRLPVLAGGLTAGAAATAAAVLVLAGGPGTVAAQHGTSGHARTVVTAAWTVRQDADGTVTVYLRQYADPVGLQQPLQADGVNAIVRSMPYAQGPLGVPYATCNYVGADAAPQDVQHAVVTVVSLGLFIIHPDAIPQGSALFLPFLAGMPVTPKNGNTGVRAWAPVVLSNDTVPACVPRAKPLPTFPPASSKP